MRHEKLIKILNALGHPKVLLVGDFMLDRYVYGKIERISPEAPVMVVNVTEREEHPGGAGSAAADLAVLEAEVHCLGVVGNDNAGKRLRSLLELTKRISTGGLLSIEGRPTTTKQRIVGIAQHRHRQQLMRIDEERIDGIEVSVQDLLRQRFMELLSDSDVVCLEDYNKGVLAGEGFCRDLIGIACRAGKRVIVDPAPIDDYRRYEGAWMIKPNRRELSRAAGIESNGEENLLKASQKMSADFGIENIVATLDRQGAYLFERNHNLGRIVPTRPRSVYDVTGAGDMVLAMLGLLVGGSINSTEPPTMEEIVQLTNVAGGLEVERFGCVAISRSEILDDLVQHSRSGAGKFRSVESLLPDLQRHRLNDERIVFTNGCFDILHGGHLNLLNFAKDQGDVLVVAINSDHSVRQLKGDRRPILKEQERATILSALEAVDYVTVFDELDPGALIERITPDILIKGADWTGKVVGQEWVERHGGEVRLIPLTEGGSTTSIIEEVLTRYQGQPHGSRKDE